MSKLTKEIRERLSLYVAGNLEPAAFREWFAVLLRDVHKSNDPEADMLAHWVEWQFLDAETGAISLEALKTNLTYLSREQRPANPVQFLTATAGGQGDTGLPPVVEVPGQQNKWYSSESTSTGSNVNIPCLV